MSRSARFLSLSILLCLAAACSKTPEVPAESAAEPAKTQDPATVEDQKTIYAMGRLAAEQLEAFAFNEEEREQFMKGVRDQLEGKGEPLKAQDYAQRINGLTQSRLAILATNEKKKGDAYVVKAAAEPGVQKLPSGMIYKEVQAGTGPSPRPMDGVRLQLKLSDIDGKVIENSLERGQPVSLIVGSVVPCLSQGLQQMKAGGKAHFVCPAETAYGNQTPDAKIKPGQTLVFDVELLEVVPDAAKKMAAGQGGQPGQPAQR
ncbi:MAG TPA: FKBP-type peptidyl-prolyl cis-trans isomerase [Candidatus Polarisedimenticolaceae bacterium]|nr:FKBP-type peptidyl-prolyl cis-trans isomerase [Candidatus Polarisedimenticolaceae bacterium]